eukprot:scaffold5586_cov285-Prasinococcus_capsulatus_cf.AAC.1
MGLDLDLCVEKLRRCEFLEEDQLKALCDRVRSYVNRRLVAVRPSPESCGARVAGEGDDAGGEQRAAGVFAGNRVWGHPWAVPRPAEALRNRGRSANHQLHLHG